MSVTVVHQAFLESLWFICQGQYLLIIHQNMAHLNDKPNRCWTSNSTLLCLLTAKSDFTRQHPSLGMKLRPILDMHRRTTIIYQVSIDWTRVCLSHIEWSKWLPHSLEQKLAPFTKGSSNHEWIDVVFSSHSLTFVILRWFNHYFSHMSNECLMCK